MPKPRNSQGEFDMSSETWVCFDTETTSLVGPILRPLSAQPHVIEFGAVLFSLDEHGKGEELATLDFLCDPGVPICKGATETHGMVAQNLAGHPPFACRAQEVADFIGGARVRTGHNIRFDADMMALEFSRLGRPAPWPACQRAVCTVEYTEWLFGWRVKLGDLHLHCMGFKHKEAHRALPDVRANVACVRALRMEGIL